MARHRDRRTHVEYAVVGTSFANADGTARQALLAAARPGDPVRLEAEPDNPHDSDAVRVVRADGATLGYLARTDASAIAPLLRRGVRHQGSILRLTGGTPDKPTRGLVIAIY